MCLGIPMQVRSITGSVARCETRGIARDVSLFLLDEPVTPGDFVLVHVGYALRRIDPAAAADALALRVRVEEGGSGA